MKKMNLNGWVLPAVLLGSTALMSCSTTQKTTDPYAATANPVARPVENTVAQRNDASYYTEITFARGSAKLADSDCEAIKNLVDQSLKAGPIDQIKVITWSDDSYPAKGMKKLSRYEQKIADERNTKIREFLTENYPLLDVKVYSMAKRPNVLQNLFNTADAKTKKTYEDAGVVAVNDSDHEVKNQNSKSLILSVLKDKDQQAEE